jgi:PST family polysaccharide transporter
MNALFNLIHKTYRMIEPPGSSRGLHNVLSLSGLQIITYILPIIIVPYLFRVIGPEKFGLIAFAQAFVQYFMIITDYGFNVSATKEISLCGENKAKMINIISAVMTLKTVLAFLSLLILCAVVYFVPRFKDDWLVYALSFGTVLGNTLFPAWFFQGTETMKYTAKLNIIGQFAYAFGIFIFIHSHNDFLLVPAITSLSALITGLLGQYILFARFDVSFQFPKLKDLHRQLQAGWNVFISVVAINAYTTTRVFAVGLLTNNTLTGFYSVAERISNAVQTFPLYSFTQAVFPRLSKIYSKNQLKAFEIMQQVQRITVIISLIFLPLVFILAPMIVKLVCGGSYPAAVLSLRFLLVSVLFIGSNAFRVQFLLVCGKTDIYSRIHITMAIIGLPLIIVLIYAFSYVGAAVATTLIEGGVFTMTYFAIKRLTFK